MSLQSVTLVVTLLDMRVAHAIHLLVLVLGLYYLFGFSRELYWLFRMRDDRGMHLIGEPYVRVIRDYAKNGENDGLWLFSSGEAPEGTQAVFSFPSWPIAITAAVAVIFSLFMIFAGKNRYGS